MSKAQLDRKDLPVDVQEKLNEILVQDAEGLSGEDAGFLNARRDYLNSSEKERFSAVLNPVAVSSDETPSDGAEVVEVPVKRMNHGQLLAKAAELGISEADVEGKSNKDLIAIIESVQA